MSELSQLFRREFIKAARRGVAVFIVCMIFLALLLGSHFIWLAFQ